MNINYSLKNNSILDINLDGDYTNYSNDIEKQHLFSKIKSNNIQKVNIFGKNLKKWDSTLVIILFNILKITKSKNIKTNIQTLPDSLQRLLNLAFSVDRKPKIQLKKKKIFTERIGEISIHRYQAFIRGLKFFTSSLNSLQKFFSGKAIMRKVDFFYALQECTYKALPIVTLISFMIGLILAFVGSIQLKNFGAQIYVASLVSIGMVRIMGPAMAGVIMAGRTGASYAATIGTMQVNEEINALKTMGIPIMDFLTLPRLLAMMISMPLLSMFADIIGIIGGASVGVYMLNIPFQEYWRLSINILNLKNFLIGIFHGYIYGWIIALCGCYYGIYCGNDADSVGKATTMAVVSAIVWIIIATGIITFICQIYGI